MERNALVVALINQFEQDTWEFTTLCFAILARLQQLLEEDNMDPARYCILNVEQQLITLLLGESWDMKEHIRVSEAAFNNLLEMISTTQHHGWGEKLKLIIFLFWLACGASYRVISAAFHIPKTTVHDIIHGTMEKVTGLSGAVIRIPNNEEVALIGRGFSHMAGNDAFSIVAGAIDGCHVEVKVSGPNHADYFSRKLKYTVQFQVVCDNKGLFLHVFAGYPGSVHDSRVLRASPLMAGLYPPQGYALLGDSGYPCIRGPVTILTPYREPVQGRVQERFNSLHRRGRNIVERALGMLKSRWRCIFMQRLCVKHTKVARVIGACCVMHNICVLNGDVLQEERIEIDPEADHQDDAQRGGFALRDEVALRASRPNVQPQHLREHDYVL